MLDPDRPSYADMDLPDDVGCAQLQLDKIRPQHRFFAALQVPDEALREQATDLAADMNHADAVRADERFRAGTRARRTAAPLPTPESAHPVSRSTMQLNVRLRRDDHARLTDAAAFVGLRPTTLARALVLNGVAKILQERAT